MQQLSSTTATSLEELLVAASNTHIARIVVRGTIVDAPSIRLSPGQHLVGETENTRILFRSDSDGLQLTSDNEVRTIHLETAPHQRAIYNDTSVSTLGNLVLDHLTTIGQVQILAKDQVHAGHISVNGLDIVAADTRSQPRLQTSVVDVLQGAFTLWNQQPAIQTVLTADLAGIALGREGAPVIGSGVFVSGRTTFGEIGLKISQLETDSIFCDGKIPEGVANLISGGVFVLYGAHVDEVRNHGPVVTYGPNDMVLDTWGEVDHWIAESNLTSYGTSGIGFVNFGTTQTFRALRPIETFGSGARGFNAYDGVVGVAEFARIETHGDGAVGIQISRPVIHLLVHEGIITHGSTGQSLVKGVIEQLPAYGLSVKSRGYIGEMVIDKGGISTEGDQVITMQVQGEIGTLRVRDGIKARGHGSDAIHVEGGSVSLEDLDIKAVDGVALRLNDAHLTALRTVKAQGVAGDVMVEPGS